MSPEAKSSFVKPAAGTRKRVKRVEEVLDLLSHLPAEEPSSTLVAATLKFIRRHEHDGVAVPAAGIHRGATVAPPVSIRTLH